jgi:hypothetical protein
LASNFKEGGFKEATYLGAILSMIGALLTIFLKQNSGDWSMNNQNIAGSFNNLVNYRIEAEELLQSINVKIKFIKTNVEEIMELIKQCNDMNRKIRSIIDKYII